MTSRSLPYAAPASSDSGPLEGLDLPEPKDMGPLYSMENFKKHLIDTEWFPGRRNQAGRTVSGILATRAFVEAQKKTVRDHVELRLRQLLYVLKQETPEHRSLTDRYWLRQLQENLPNHYASWGPILRKIRNQSGESSAPFSFRQAWETDPLLMALSGDPMQVLSAQEYPAKDLFNLACVTPDLFSAPEPDAPPTLWSWLTKSELKAANENHPLAWDWDLLLGAHRVSAEVLWPLMGHPLAVSALEGSGFLENRRPDRQANDAPVVSSLVELGKRLGLAIDKPTLLGLAKDRRTQFLHQLSRAQALTCGLPQAKRSGPKPRF